MTDTQEEEEYTDDTDPFMPQVLDDYVGQSELKRRLQVYMDAAIAAHEPLGHVFLAAPPGFGKTTLAHLIGKYLNDPAYRIDLPSMSAVQFASTMKRFPGGILFIDEAHRASKLQLTGLLTLLEEGQIISPAGYPIEVPWLTAIIATTEPEKIPEPLKERCLIKPTFGDYSDEDATTIVRQMCMWNNLDIPGPTAEGMGHACAGTPRLAKNLVKAYKALHIRNEGLPPSLDEVLDLCELDREGLEPAHYQYLRALDKLNGQAGERPLMNVLRLNSPAALFDIERVLLMRDLISLTGQGRCLMPAGDAVIRGGRKQYRREVAKRYRFDGNGHDH